VAAFGSVTVYKLG